MSKETRIINPLHFSTNQAEQFKSKVEALNGKLPTLVHPFYSDYHGDSDRDHAFTTSRYPIARDKLLYRLLALEFPVLIFEQQKDIDKLPYSIDRLGGGSVYALETGRDTHNIGPDSWESLTRILKENGVRTVYIGGMYMINYKTETARYYAYHHRMDLIDQQREQFIQANPHAARWLRNDIMPTGCAGSATIHFLASGFDVAITSASTPSRWFEYFPVQFEQLNEGEEI